MRSDPERKEVLFQLFDSFDACDDPAYYSNGENYVKGQLDDQLNASFYANVQTPAPVQIKHDMKRKKSKEAEDVPTTRETKDGEDEIPAKRYRLGNRLYGRHGG